KEIKEKFGQKTALGKRRTLISAAPGPLELPLDALVEEQPVTVVLWHKGWDRALKGHNIDPTDIKHKEGDESYLDVRAQTTDKLLIMASDGRVYTVDVINLPGGRGFGEPLHLMLDIATTTRIINLHVYNDKKGMLLVSDEDRGF